MTVTVKVSKGIWKGFAVIVLIIAIGAGVIWAYQTNSRQITLYWNPLPAGITTVTAVRIYDIADPASPVKVAEVSCTIVAPYTCPMEVTFAMSQAVHVYVARYWDGFWESADSNSVSVPGPVSPPTGLKKR